MVINGGLTNSNIVLFSFMKYAIIGSRSYANYAQFEATVDIYTDITEIISGGARGVDKMAERYAEEHNMPCKIFLPDWDKYGKSAGYIRNKDIVAAADKILAFWDFESKGTKHTLQLADQVNKPYIIHLTIPLSMRHSKKI